jgi:hypothetical protein
MWWVNFWFDMDVAAKDSRHNLIYVLILWEKQFLSFFLLLLNLIILITIQVNYVSFKKIKGGSKVYR